jgi:hypothetical protein
MPEYETFWNGVNDGRDGDHLSAPRIAEKRPAAPQPSRVRVSAVSVVEAVLPTSRAQALTLTEIAQAAAIPKGKVNSALYLLRRHGRLQTFAIVQRRSRCPQRYYRTGGPS